MAGHPCISLLRKETLPLQPVSKFPLRPSSPLRRRNPPSSFPSPPLATEPLLCTHPWEQVGRSAGALGAESGEGCRRSSPAENFRAER